jgi:ABC-type transporter Mla subunit MlaD
MPQEKQINYLRIGSFVVTGIILFIVAILVLGSGMLFKKVTYVETYFNESVQGLSEGSLVKYLGMEIGHVVEINTIDNVYKIQKDLQYRIHRKYIYVKMAIYPKFFNGFSRSEIANQINKEIAAGLRVKLAPQGLTGNVYIELDFLDPKTHPILPIYWQPENIYIPSTTSTLAFFTDNAQYLLNELKQIDFKKLFASMQQLVDESSKLAYRSNKLLAETQPQTINVVDNLNALSEQAKAFPSHIIFGKAPPKLKPGKL